MKSLADKRQRHLVVARFRPGCIAANADASPIVCDSLDSGTIPALTLAFDCAEASTEIDPDLRYRLDRERRRAYEPDCSPAHRRPTSRGPRARLVRQARVTTGGAARVCVRAVPADLYWLFLADAQAPRPDSRCDPLTDQPATGIWGAEAQAFVRWLNLDHRHRHGHRSQAPLPR